MNMSKCDNCKKNISKSLPGVECSKCERVVHLNSKCTGLTVKQIAALKAAPSLEWTCSECQQEIPGRRSSIIIPEEDEDYEDGPIPFDAKKLLGSISKEVERAIKREMTQLNDSLQFHSAKLDEVMECMEVFKKTIKVLERKNAELNNKNNNLETRIGVLEQRLQESEQEKISTCIEIANVPSIGNEETRVIVDNIACILKQPKEEIKSTRRIYARKDQPPNIVVELKHQGCQERWIAAAKSNKITVANIHPTEKTNKNIVYVREAMTKINKQLFWCAKQELKLNQCYKYVWFKKGVIRARKDDGDKAIIIRSMDQIVSLTKV